MNERMEMVEASRRLVELDLNRGSSGNISLRLGKHFLVTPSALPPESMKPEDMVLMDIAGHVLEGERPSSEWRAIQIGEPRILSDLEMEEVMEKFRGYWRR